MSESKSDEKEPTSAKPVKEPSEREGSSTNGSARLEAEDKEEEKKETDAEATDAEAKEEKSDEKAESKAREEDKAKEPDIVPRGNSLNWKRAIPTILGGAIPAFCMMAKNGHNAWSIPFGIVFVLIAAFGVMDLLGTFDDPDEQVATTTTLGEIGIPLLRTIALAIAFALTLWAAQGAILPTMGSIILVPLSFLALVASIFGLGRVLGPWRVDELGLERPLFRRHGFWVIAVGTVLYMPALGLFSLWDPWETHYGEVAREILARDDWISLWWAQDGWFWSKPILNFWIQSISMSTLGTGFKPDLMLIAANGSPAAHPEWVVRTPNVLMTIGAMYLLYKGVAKVFGRRAGLLGAIVLATMPDWFFLAHQTMTDMPFVAAMTAAMGLLLFGLNTHEEERVRVYEVKLTTSLLGMTAIALGVILAVFGFLPGQNAPRRFLLWIGIALIGVGVAGWRANRAFAVRLSLWHLVFGAVLVCAIPQILYLFSRNLELVVFGDGPHGFRAHWDEFSSGSTGNCGLPGNENCRSQVPASIPKSVGANPSGAWPTLVRFFGAFEPSFQALIWGGVIGGVLYINWGERRARRLLYIGAWLCAAIATMAKGPAGFAVPMICAFAYVATKKRWNELLRFELVSGLLIILAVALPWYVAMYVRHGSPFTDRLIFHDMFNRAFSHVHDTNEGDDTGIRYYIWQLGYAVFPWTGLAPIGLLWWARKSDSADAGRRPGFLGATGNTGDASVMLVMWFLFAFALFTFMGTKFHHYIFPAVPPIAMLIGVALDDMIGNDPLAQPQKLAMYIGGLAVAAVIAVFGAASIWPGSIMGKKLENASGSVFMGGVVIAIGVALFSAVILLFRDRTPPQKTEGTIVQAPGQSPFRGGVVVEGESAEETRRRFHEQLMLGACTIAGALLTILVGRDLATKPEGADQPGAIRLLQLFTYNYRRPRPDTLDFSAILTGFTVIAVLLAIALSVRAIRRHAVAAFCAFAFVWALGGLDVYMVALSPHWGQHEVIEAYYRDRKGPDEQLVAYQMNWKGENFYTSNRVPAFVSSGATFQTWLKGQREKGARVMYFITEHSRTGGLRNEVGAKSYKEITDKALCNKFILVRAEL